MKETKERNKKNHGITLIALVITIIVMLILVAVTITMAVNGGLFGKAAEAGRQTNEAVALEQELGSGRIKVGNTWYDSPQDYVDGKKSDNQKDGEQETPETPEGNEPPQNEGTLLPTTEKGVGYYADIDGVDGIDGIIYADMAKGNTNGTMWIDENGTYTIPVKTNLKEYNLSEETVNGPFGPKKVVTLANDDETKNDRFYVMALTDFTANSDTTFSWDYKWNEKTFGTSTEFESGVDNTELLINTDKVTWDNRDIWKNLSATSRWFVPSRAEWSAFAQELGITYENYSDYGLIWCYWSSSQYDSITAWYVRFESDNISNDTVEVYYGVRLSTTF